MTTFRRALFKAFSAQPEDALSIEEIALPPLPAGHVRLKMAFAPVNPADINVVQGVYGSLPDLPATPGIEGAGRVAEVAPDVNGWEPGDLAVPLDPNGTWTSHFDIPADAIIKIPADIPFEQASMLRVNPVTAWHLIHTLTQLEPGSWIVQNAATSAVGHCVTGLAHTLGINLLNISRRPSGEPHHITDDESSLAEAKSILGGSPVPLALNAVGGESALRLMNLLTTDGTLVTYGAMARRPIKVPNSMLIFKNLTLRGFWLTRWLKSAPRHEIDSLFEKLAGYMVDRSLGIPVDTVYPLDQIRDAVAHAQQPGRNGKILIDLS